MLSRERKLQVLPLLERRQQRLSEFSSGAEAGPRQVLTMIQDDSGGIRGSLGDPGSSP